MLLAAAGPRNTRDGAGYGCGCGLGVDTRPLWMSLSASGCDYEVLQGTHRRSRQNVRMRQK